MASQIFYHSADDVNKADDNIQALDKLVDELVKHNNHVSSKGFIADSVALQVDALSTLGSFQVPISECMLRTCINAHILANYVEK